MCSACLQDTNGNLKQEKSTGRLLEIIAASYTQQLTTAAKFCSFFQLIDLSSPLITLSPDVNKENLDSPLLKFWTWAEMKNSWHLWSLKCLGIALRSYMVFLKMAIDYVINHVNTIEFKQSWCSLSLINGSAHGCAAMDVFKLLAVRQKRYSFYWKTFFLFPICNEDLI